MSSINLFSNKSQSGKSALVVSLLLTLVLCVGFVCYFVWWNDGPVKPVLELVGNTSDETPDRQPGSDLEKKLSGGPEVDPIVGHQGKSGEDLNSQDAAGETGVRIFGKVHDTEGKPIPAVTLRWVRVREAKLEPYSHDGNVLGKDIDLERLPEGKLRESLSRSLVTESGEDGKYQFNKADPEDTASNNLGVVIASSLRYETSIQPVKKGKSRGDEFIRALREAGMFREKENGKLVGENAREKQLLRDLQSRGKVVEEEGGESSREKESEKGAHEGQAKSVRVDFRLRTAGSISGTVLDKETRKPVSGMGVCADEVEPDSIGMFSFFKFHGPSSETGPDGTYYLQGLPVGEYNVVPRTGRSDYVSVLPNHGKKVVLKEGLEVTDVDFQVRLGGKIMVTVFDSGDKPLEGVNCSVVPENVMSAALQGRMGFLMGFEGRDTDESGYFEKKGLPLNKKYRVNAKKEGFAPFRSDPLELTSEKPEIELEFSMNTGWSISGHVLFTDGSPAAGVRVQIIPDFGDVTTGRTVGDEVEVKADKSGAFKFEHLSKGEYTLGAGDVSRRLFFSKQQDTVSVVLDGKENVTGIELIMEREKGEATISGVVVDNWGEAVEKARVFVEDVGNFMGGKPVQDESEEDGGFLVTGLKAEGLYRLRATKSGYMEGVLNNVEAGRMDCELVLKRFGRISGRVLLPEGASSDTGGKVKPRPAKKGTVQDEMEKLRNMQSVLGLESEIGSDGTFSLEVPPGDIQVQAFVPGFAPSLSAPLEVEAGREYKGVEIYVTVGALVFGKVVLPDGSPVEGATVTVQSAKDDDLLSRLRNRMPQFLAKERNRASSDGEGIYEIANLVPGEYSIVAEHTRFSPSDPQKVVLQEGEEFKVPDLVLSEGGRIAGVVLEKGENEAKPKAGVMIQLMGGETLKQAYSDGEGRFHFKGLKPGEYALNLIDMASVQKGKINTKTRAVTVEDNEVVEMEIVLGAGHKVYGTVVGLPEATIRVITLRRPGGPAPEKLDPTDIKARIEAAKYNVGTGMISPEGKYEIVDVEPGEYIIEIANMPKNPGDLEAYKNMDRTPHFRKKITVGDEDYKLDIKVE